MDEKGQMIWRILFGVIMAGLLLAVLVTYFQSQKKAEIGREAQALVDGISRAGFSILSGGQIDYDLPGAVGDAPYKVSVDDKRNAVVVRITGGSQKGVEYMSVIDADIQVHSLPDRGEVLYIAENKGKVVLSELPLQIPKEKILPYPTPIPPDFYYFARENPREASALGASYFWALGNYPGEESLDVREYDWKDLNTLLARVTSIGESLAVVRVSGRENDVNVGVVEYSWVIHQVENSDEEFIGESCPSIKMAYENGWIYSPEQVIDYLQSRSWRRTDDNKAVEIPTDPSIQYATSTTNVDSYPTYLIEFSAEGEDYSIYFRTMPWYYEENQAGFVFQSKPELEPTT